MYWFTVGLWIGVLLSVTHFVLFIVSRTYKVRLQEFFEGTIYGDVIELMVEPDENENIVIVHFIAMVITVVVSICVFLLSWLLSYVLAMVVIGTILSLKEGLFK